MQILNASRISNVKKTSTVFQMFAIVISRREIFFFKNEISRFAANDSIHYTLKTNYTFVMPSATKWRRGTSVMSDCPSIERPFRCGQVTKEYYVIGTLILKRKLKTSNDDQRKVCQSENLKCTQNIN